MAKSDNESLSTDPVEIENLIERVRHNQLAEQDYRLLERLLRLLLNLAHIMEQKNASLARLKRILFGPKSGPPPSSATGSGIADKVTVVEQKPKPAGHGRMGASAYPGAKRIRCTDPARQAGDRCACGGKLYDTNTPAVFLRFTGQPLVGATHYEQPVLRCSACQNRFTAPLPDGVPAEKYDATADVAIVMAKYAAGLPFYRLARMQQAYGIPLPESVQWDRSEQVANALLPVYLFLRWLAAQAEVLIGDDTRVQILACEPDNRQRALAGERHGLHTTGMVAQNQERAKHTVILYTSGRQHSGENLGELLQQRATELAPPLQVGDALAANWSHSVPVIAVKCLVHARRQFTEIEEWFPEQCGYVRQTLAAVYRYEAETKQMTPEERLAHHQLYSAPVMEQLHAWMEEELQQKRAEPNSALGKAFAYLQRHWQGLTQFLRQLGAPLDSNAVEQALKRVVLHRKNALFFRTEHGAAVGDILMSVIETCRANSVRAWDYLVDVVRNASAVRDNPAGWLPWTYQPTT